MFNWIFKKIASYVQTPTVDYAKLAEALNINNLANQIVISEEVIAEKNSKKNSLRLMSLHMLILKSWQIILIYRKLHLILMHLIWLQQFHKNSLLLI